MNAGIDRQAITSEYGSGELVVERERSHDAEGRDADVSVAELRAGSAALLRFCFCSLRRSDNVPVAKVEALSALATRHHASTCSSKVVKERSEARSRSCRKALHDPSPSASIPAAFASGMLRAQQSFAGPSKELLSSAVCSVDVSYRCTSCWQLLSPSVLVSYFPYSTTISSAHSRCQSRDFGDSEPVLLIERRTTGASWQSSPPCWHRQLPSRGVPSSASLLASSRLTVHESTDAE